MSGSGSSQPTNSTVTNTSIPSYAQPYVESTLGKGAALTDTSKNPYTPYQGQQVAGFTPAQAQAFSNISNQSVAPQIAAASNIAQGVGERGLGAYGVSGDLQGAALGYGQMGAGLAGQNLRVGQAGLQAGMSYGQDATNPGAVQAYMNPYLRSTLQPAQQLLNQQYGIQGAAEQSAATSKGAFGGSRSALQQGLNEQNRNLANNQLVSNAYNSAYDTANKNMQQAASLGIQGANVGLQGLQGANQSVNTGLSGVNSAINAGQYGLSGLGSAGQAASTLGALGQTQFNQTQAANQDLLKVGNQQQAQQQQGLNVNYQNYANQLNYPYQQLAFMQGLYSGLPLSQSATTQYNAQPPVSQQLLGLGLGAAGASKAFS